MGGVAGEMLSALSFSVVLAAAALPSLTHPLTVDVHRTLLGTDDSSDVVSGT